MTFEPSPIPMKSPAEPPGEQASSPQAGEDAGECKTENAPGASPKKRIKKGVHYPQVASELTLLFVAPLLGLLLLEGFARGGLWFVFSWAASGFGIFLMNYFAIACIFWLLFVFRSDRVRGCLAILLMLVLAALGMISDYKMRYRFEPILLTDVWQLGEMRTTLGQMHFDIHWQPLLVVLGLGFGAMVLCFIFCRRLRPKINLALPVLGGILFCCLLPACTFGNQAVNGSTDLSEYARKGGALYTALASETQRLETARMQYNPGQVSAEYEQARKLTQPDKAGTPNLIFILSEAFYDQAHLSNFLDFTEPVTPFFQELTQSCRSGEIYVPKQGGGTSETEFEVLTGLKSGYTINPYSMGIPKLHSVAAVMRERGYNATALHWYDGVYYNRYKNLKELGFDSFYTLDTTTRDFELLGQYVTDAEHYRSIMERMKESNTRDFVFSITMQNHFPYTEEDYAQTRHAPTPFRNQLSSQTELILRNYCYLLSRSDAALRDFIAELSAFEEPTLLVFFGDHVPAFGEAAYAELGMPTEGTPSHLTPYLIWSNVENTPIKADMQAWQLGAYALNVAGVRSDPFFAYVEALRQSKKNEDKGYDILSHDALLGTQQAYRQEGFQIESPNWQIGGEMKLLGFETAEIDGAVYVLPRLQDPDQAFRLAVNGDPLEDWKVLLTDEPFTLQCVMMNTAGRFFNQSASVTFDSTAQLLQSTTRPEMPALDLGKLSYTISQEKDAYFVVESQIELKGQLSCLTLDGKRLEWQRPYGFQGAGQYYLGTGNGPISITIDQGAFQGYEKTSRGVASYLADHQARLIRFRHSVEKPSFRETFPWH